MIQFLPTELQILHNTGVFHYEKLSMLFFALKLALFPVTLIFVLFCIYRIILKRTRTHRQLQTAIFTGTILFILLCIFVYPGVTSKLYFARGYDHYLNNKDTEACNDYLKSLNTDDSFIKPLRELITIYKKNPGNTLLLKQIAKKADVVASDAIFAQIGRLFEDNKDYIVSLKYYKKARKINPEITYTISIIRNLIALNNYSKAETELSKVPQGNLSADFSEDLHFFSSVIDFKKGLYKKANEAIDKLLNPNTTDPLYFIHKARILTQSGDYANALETLSHAISLKKELPEAYFERAKIYYLRRDLSNTQDTLEKTLYYNNHHSLAYAMLQMVLIQKWLPLESLILNNNIKAMVGKGRGRLQLVKGDSITSSVTFRNVSEPRRFKIGLLEPYGFGLKSELIGIKKHTFEDGNQGLRAVFTLQALRSSKVNLNHPWVLNIVLVDIDSGYYVSKLLSVAVNPDENEEGKILFVITEDHERLGDFPSSDETPHILDVDPYEINIDLVQKSLFADDLANKYGIKWSHIIDIGSSFLRLKWIQNGRYGGKWDTVWDNMASYLKRTISMGHDIQLHIHGYSIPDNKLFRQYFDPEKNKIFFKDNIVRPEIAKDIHGAWAYNFINLGNYDDSDSRIGSVFSGIRELESELHNTDPSYRTVFFRAGEYEFGGDEQTVRKSIFSLTKNKILCGSDAHFGSLFKRDFKFFRKVGKNVYFSKGDNIHERAISLLDIGVLQILPVPKINAHNYVRPIDHWKHIKYNYDLCFSGGKIRSDIFILLEMYHLYNVNAKYEWDNIREDYEDWGRMDDHFKYIKTNCPKIEFLTISEAIKIYLDCYAPDIVGLRTNENKITEKLYTYNIEFYGRDIEVTGQRPHFVSIKPPSYLLGKIDRIDLTHDGGIVRTWRDLKDYSDLAFQIVDKTGYKIRVYLN